MPAILIGILTSLAGSSDIFSAKAIGNYIDLALDIFNTVGESDTALTALHDNIKQMIAEKRDPTAAEFDALKARSDAAHSHLQSL